jgi:hypothetical protein
VLRDMGSRVGAGIGREINVQGRVEKAVAKQ